MNGKLIVFEGLDGAGKSTQIFLLREWLQSHHKIPQENIVTTRQPGGTGLGVYLKRLLISSGIETPSPMTELLLFASDRSQHMDLIVLPALDAGKIVICDRYVYSTVAYQGYGRGLDLEKIHLLNDISCLGVEPDLAFFLDVDLENSAKRLDHQEKDRIEMMDRDFHNRVRDGFLSQNLINIDANKDVAGVMKQITGHVDKTLFA